MNISRRALGGISTAAILAAAGACSTITTAVSQGAMDAELIASGIGAALAAVKAISGASSTLIDQLQGYVTTIQEDATAIATATASTGANLAQFIEAAVKAAAPLLLSLIPGGSALASTITPLVNAAVSLVSSLLSEYGVTSEIVTSEMPKYTPAEARLILRGAMAKP